MKFNPYTQRYLDMIEKDYRPDHDRPDGIQVTWVDHTLYQAIIQLKETVREQNQKIAELEERLDQHNGVLENLYFRS